MANGAPRPNEDRPPGGPPNQKPRDRGSRFNDPNADSIMPGREFGAGDQIDDGPGVSGGGAKPAKPS